MTSSNTKNTKENDLEVYRKIIDDLDSQLLELLSKRLEIVSKVGKYKKQHSLPPLDQKRWEQVLDKLKLKADKAGIDFDLVKQIWNLIHEKAIEIEQKLLD